MKQFYAGNVKNITNILNLFPDSTDEEIEIYFEVDNIFDEKIPIDKICVLYNKIIFIKKDILLFVKNGIKLYNEMIIPTHLDIIAREKNNGYHLSRIDSKELWVSHLRVN